MDINGDLFDPAWQLLITFRLESQNSTFNTNIEFSMAKFIAKLYGQGEEMQKHRHLATGIILIG